MSVKPGFRDAMTWLHTWSGIILGALLFTVFWMGTLSVFDREIDQWMQPEIRLPATSSVLNADQIVSIAKARMPEDQLTSMLIYLPLERRRYIEYHAGFEKSGGLNDRLHPQTGESLGESKSKAASGFIYPMHYRLHGMQGLGYWFIAFGTLIMMLLLVTGVVIHRKIFIDFFTFRARKKLRRSSLDLHNITGTVFLPFHFLICFSGLAIFAGWYLSLASSLVPLVSDGDRTVELFYAADDYAYYQRESADEPADMVALMPLVEQAESIWTERYGQSARADRIDITHFGDKNAYVEVRRHFPSNRTEAHRDSVNFAAASGEILMDFEASAVRKVRTWLEGFHQIQFDRWLIRWLYFIAGLAGCVMIATGFIFWVASRTNTRTNSKPLNVRLVEAMNVGSVTGAIVATVSFFVANRVLAMGDLAGDVRAELEIDIFFFVWILSFAHAVLRHGRAWIEQCWAIALLGVVAVFLNWATTGDHPFGALCSGVWSVAGMDMVLMLGVLTAVVCAFRMQASQADTLMPKSKGVEMEQKK